MRLLRSVLIPILDICINAFTVSKDRYVPILCNDFSKKIGEVKAKGVTGNIKSGLKGTYNIGAAGAQSIRENADWFYGLLYAIVLSLVVCIITIPSIAFFIMGLICYVLLKNKMKFVKGL